MSQNVKHVVCPHCDSVNRIADGRQASEAKCGRCHKPLFQARSFPITAARFDAHIGRSDIPVLVDFWAEWCGPCKAMAPVYERLAAEFDAQVRFLKVDTDAAPELAARFSIRGIPTLILFHRGKVLAQRAGALPVEAVRAWLAQVTPIAAGAA